MARQGWEETPEEAAQRAANEEQNRKNRIDSGGGLGEQAPDYAGGKYGKPGDTTAYDADVNRAQTMGAASAGRSANQLNQAQADETRGLQMGGLGLLGGAARGQAPSRAAALGASATDASTRSALSGLAGARGPGAAVAAANQAGAASGAQMAQQNAAASQMLAEEMGRARDAYAGAAQATEGQDIGAASKNAQLQAQQNVLNENRQQGFEGRAHDVRNLQGNLDAKQRIRIQEQKRKDTELARQKAATDKDDTKGVIDTGLSLAAAAASIFSDERTKKNTQPVFMGSLAHLLGRRR